MPNQRSPYIDFAAAIMILWMIIYHALCYSWGFDLREYWEVTDLSLLPQGVKAQINDNGRIEIINPCVFFPYLSFFMPWFFYKSGQFFRKKPCKEQVKKDAHKLLRTFVIWSAVGYVMFLMFGLLQHTITLRSATYSIIRGLFLTGKVPINEPLWFLLTLFGVRTIANLILPDKDSKFSFVWILVIILFGYIISYLAYLFKHPLLPLWMANGVSGLAFFALGYGLSGYESKWWLIFPCVAVYVLCCIFGFPMVDMMFNKLLAGKFLLWIPVAFCGIVTCNFLCQLVYRYISIKPMEVAGQNAMPIYVTHILIALTCTFVLEYFDMVNFMPYTLWIILGGYAIFLPVFCYFFNRIGGKKSA